MMLNISYNDAVSAIFPHRKSHTKYATSIEHISDGFERLGYRTYWKSPLLDNRPVIFNDLKRNAIVILDLGDDEYHAVVYNAKEKAIYDPLIDHPVSLTDDRIQLSNRKNTMSVQNFYGKKVFAYMTFRRVSAIL